MNDAPVTISVHGTPKPQGSMRHVGRGRLVHKTDLLDWRTDVTIAATKAMNARLPLDGPLEVSVTFYLTKPKSAAKTVAYPIKRPDLDKLVRGVMDALTYGGVYHDDSQVIAIYAFKAFTRDDFPIPGAHIRVTPVHTTHKEL